MISSDIDAGRCHNDMLGQARDTQLRISTLPANMLAMLQSRGWHRLVRPVDSRVFEHETVTSWVLGEPWAGLAFPDWATLYALLDKNIECGSACLDLLHEEGAPTLEAATRDFETKRARAKGVPPSKGLIGNGRSRRDNMPPTSAVRSTSAEYLSRRLLRDAPAIFAALERGEYPSIRSAAVAAGLIHPPIQVSSTNPESAVRTLLKHFTATQLLEALHVAEVRRADR